MSRVLIVDPGHRRRDPWLRHHSPSEELAKQGMATSAGSLIKAGAQPVYGDMKERASLALACQGIESVITTANSAMRGGEDSVDTVDRAGNRKLEEIVRRQIAGGAA